MNLKKFFLDLKKKIFKPKQISTVIDPESLKTKEEIRHLMNAYQYERGKRKKYQELYEEKTQDQSDNRDEVARELNEQKEEILNKEVGVSASLRDILNAKRKKSIHVLSYNRKRDFGILKNVGIAQNGLISIYVKGIKRPIISGRTPQEIFRDCSGLTNDANRKMISINLNESGDYVENVETIEVPNVIIDFNRKIKVLNYDTAPFIERIIEKNNEFDSVVRELRLEQKTTASLVKELNEEKKKNEVLENENMSYKSGMSDMIERFKEVQKGYGEITKNYSILLDENSLKEEFNERQNKVINSLHKKISDKEAREAIENAVGYMKNNIDWYHGKMKEMLESQLQQLQLHLPYQEEKEEEKPLPQPVKA